MHQHASPSAQWVANAFPAGAMPQNGYVSVGSLHVSAAAYPDFQRSATYLAASPETAALLHRVATAPGPTVVESVPVNAPGGSNYASMTTGTDAQGRTMHGSRITWDPHSVVVDTNGKPHSAAVVLGHELTHADVQVRDPAGTIARVGNVRSDGFTNDEEHRDMTVYEHPVSAAVGEAIRPGHEVNGVLPGRDPTSTVAQIAVHYPHPTKSHVTHEMPTGYQQSGVVTSVTATHIVQSTGRDQVAYDRSSIEMFRPRGSAPIAAGDHLDVALGRDGALRAQSLTPSLAPGQQQGHYPMPPGQSATQPFGVGR